MNSDELRVAGIALLLFYKTFHNSIQSDQDDYRSEGAINEAQHNATGRVVGRPALMKMTYMYM